MKKFLVTVLAILMVISMSACTKTVEHERLDADGNLKGYVVETLDATLNNRCRKLEFLDENKNVVSTMQADENFYYIWSFIDPEIVSFPYTPMCYPANEYPNGVMRIILFDYENKQDVSEYYTFPFSDQIMEEYQKTYNSHDGAIYYTSVKVYNNDGSVKFSYVADEGNYFNIAMLVDAQMDNCIQINEMNSTGEDARISEFTLETYEFISSQSYEYTSESANEPKYTYNYKADGSLWYKVENIFNDEGYITDVIYYDANGNILDEIPKI